MTNETQKAVQRRLYDQRFARRYLRGHGIDIGAGSDGLQKYRQWFPLMASCSSWDIENGDAQFMESVPNGVFDFVVSSHCLEHMVDPHEALTNWLRITKPLGHVIITVPDEDLYEQLSWPSKFNPDHKWSFTIHKHKSWCEKSINLTDMLTAFHDVCTIKKIELLDHLYDYQLLDQDQTRGWAESGIEIVLQKK